MSHRSVQQQTVPWTTFSCCVGKTWKTSSETVDLSEGGGREYHKWVYNTLFTTGVYLCVYLRSSSQIARYHVTRTLAMVSSDTANQQRDTRLVQTLVIYPPIYGYVLENLHA